MNYIDTHCHILPGMDDGPATMEESVKMLEMAKDDGITHLFATPHILEGVYPNRRSEIIASVERLRSRVPGGIELLYGADIRITPDLVNRLEAKEVPTLNESGYMLIEFPEFIVPPNVETLIFALRQRGVIPILTHPERHFRLMNDHVYLRRLRDRGAMSQITAMSITGRFGREIMLASLSMIEKGLADIVASDAHNAATRPPVLSKAYKEVKKHFGDETADRLFFKNPHKIVEMCGGKKQAE